MVPTGVGLVLTPVGGPFHGRVNESFCLVTDVEQASDLGEAQADPALER